MVVARYHQTEHSLDANSILSLAPWCILLKTSRLSPLISVSLSPDIKLKAPPGCGAINSMVDRTVDIDFNLGQLINYSATFQESTAELDNIVVAIDGPLARARLSKPTRKRKRGKGKPSTLTTPFSALDTGPVRDMAAFVNRSRQVREKEAMTSKKAKRSAIIRPPRPWNSFILYRAAYSQRIKDWAGANSNQAVSKLAAESWSIEPKDIQDHYMALAAIDKENHAAAFPGYKYQPSKPRHLRYESDDYEDEPQSESEFYDDDDEYKPSKRSKRPLRRRAPRRARVIKQSPIVKQEIAFPEARPHGGPVTYTHAFPWLHKQDMYHAYLQAAGRYDAPWTIPALYPQTSDIQNSATSHNPYYTRPSYQPTMHQSQMAVQRRTRQGTPYPEVEPYRGEATNDRGSSTATYAMPPPNDTPKERNLSKGELERLMSYKLPSTPRTPATPALSLFSSLFPISPRAFSLASPPFPGGSITSPGRIIDVTSPPLLSKILTDSPRATDLLTQPVTIDPQLLAWEREGSWHEDLDKHKNSKSED